MNDKIIEVLEKIKPELQILNQYIYDNPEISFKEDKSSLAHIQLLKKYEFKVEENYLNFSTAFKASYSSLKQGPVIAFLVEYDALVGIGHGCGHNLLGTTSTGAAIVLKEMIDEIGGTIIVFGTPAEETSGVKVDLVNNNEFDKIDIALVAHPESYNMASGSSLAVTALEFVFSGKTAHAATVPEKGINALDACIQTFNSINALREHIHASARVHGVIIEGGKAANIVPDYAVAQFLVRTTSKKYRDELEEKVINCAKGAALASGTTFEYNHFEYSNDDMITNQTLSSVLVNNLKKLGVDDIIEESDFFGSMDMGNVSHVCPSVHHYFNICETDKYPLHTIEFRDATLSDYAYKSMEIMINGLVKTSIEVIENKELLQAIKEEFKENSKKPLAY